MRLSGENGDTTQQWVEKLQALLKSGAEPEAANAIWTKLFERFTPILKVWTRRFKLTRDVAEDMVQATVAKLIEKFPAYNTEKDFRPWLRKVHDNGILDQFRQESTEKTALQNVPPRAVAPEPVGDVREQISDELIRAIAEADKSVKPSTSACFWRTVMLGETVEAVAADLRIEPDSVRAQRRRFIERVREILEVAQRTWGAA